jgi:hypothetical protein
MREEVALHSAALVLNALAQLATSAVATALLVAVGGTLLT